MAPSYSKTALFSWLLIASIFSYGIFIQWGSLIGHDMSWLLHATRRFLDGGNYLNDFFEINPPMALYIHIPPLFLASFFKLDTFTAFRLYVLLISFISFFTCARLLQYMIKPHDRVIYFALLVALAVDYILLPGREFGQREQIAFMLIMPYLLLSVRKSLQQTIHLNSAICIGIMAGIGFSIKPHFMFAFALVEFYLLYKTKKISSLFSIEPLLIVSIFLIYMASIFIITPEYFQIVPYIRDFFSLFFYSPDEWVTLFTQLKVIFFVTILVIYFLFRKEIAYKTLADVLVLANIGFFLTYIAEPLFLDYHTIPLFSITLVLTALFFTHYILEITRHHWQNGIKLLDVITLLALSFLFLLLPIFVLSVELSRVYDDKRILIYSQLRQLIKNTSNTKQVYFMSTSPMYTYPLIDYAKVKTTSRFQSYWTIPYLLHLSQSNDPTKKSLLKKQADFFITTVTQDIKKGNPSLIFIDPHIGWHLYEKDTIDYLALLSTSKEFRDIWKNYRYIGSLENLEVYRRMSSEKI